MKNKIIIGILLVAAILLVTGCEEEEKEEQKLVEDLRNINYQVEGNEASLSQYETENPVVAMYVKGYGSIVMELYPDIAPNTVNNFISLVKKGFYDKNTMHRLVQGFVLQGGDPTGTGSGGPGYNIKGEFTSNGFENNLLHDKKVISMARAIPPDTAGSQFFIMLGRSENLDGNYAAFGKVIDGWSNVLKIESLEQVADLESGKLEKNLVIEKTLVDTKGKEYPEPETIKE